MPEAAHDEIRQIVIFLSFLAGATLADRVMPVWITDLEPSFGLYSAILGAVLILSTSVWGAALLPACAILLGGLTRLYADSIVKAYFSGGDVDVHGLLVNAAAVPVFFLAAVRGMRSSSMLGAMIDRQAAQCRAQYNREYVILAITVLGCMAVLRYII